ncbi:MAG: hypothetical protein P8X73_18920, partial [Ignavibacteriaceae bacterium]
MKIFTTVFSIFLFLTVSVYGQNYYLGVGLPTDTPNTSCASCHNSSGGAPPIYNDWITTRHSVA